MAKVAATAPEFDVALLGWGDDASLGSCIDHPGGGASSFEAAAGAATTALVVSGSASSRLVEGFGYALIDKYCRNSSSTAAEGLADLHRRLDVAPTLIEPCTATPRLVFFSVVVNAKFLTDNHGAST